MQEDCYFWIDSSIPEEEQTINVLCIECHDTKHPKLGWFWEGSTKGYGPYNFVCDFCQKIIHEAPKENN
jgi:hypothetical protein